jgi:hypothetical protein
MQTTSRWTAFAEARARLDAIVAEQSTKRYPTGTAEFTQFADRYVAAMQDMNAAASNR